MEVDSKLIPLSDADGEEITVYVKGFLGAGEEPEHFGPWHRGHRSLVRTHGWRAPAGGWAWSSGTWLTIPMPVASGAKLAVDVYRAVRYARVAALGATVGLAVAEVGARFLTQYLAAERRASDDAAAFAEALERLTARYDRVRVVAHSLGCRQVVWASSQLTGGARPSEIHLCAPALLEDEVRDLLPDLAADRTYLYYASNDLVLNFAFPIVAWDRPLGVVPPSGDYPGLEAIDVSDHFGFRVHGEYKNRFADFAARRQITEERTPPSPGRGTPARRARAGAMSAES